LIGGILAVNSKPGAGLIRLVDSNLH